MLCFPTKYCCQNQLLPSPHPHPFRLSSYLGQCLLNSMSCQDGTCKWDLTVGELYKCNNIIQLLFNFESSILDTMTHKGWFKPNYPLLLPKSTIKLSIKAGGEEAWAVGCRHTADCLTCSLENGNARPETAAFSESSVATGLVGALIMYWAYAVLIGWILCNLPPNISALGRLGGLTGSDPRGTSVGS